MVINDKTEKRNKNIAFISNIDDPKDECDLDIEEGIFNANVFLGKKFNKVLKKVDWKSISNFKNKSFDINKNQDLDKRTRTGDISNLEGRV